MRGNGGIEAMLQSGEMSMELARIMRVVGDVAERRAEVAKIMTTVLVMDLSAHVNKCLGQIRRRAIERMRSHG